ncbi:MAG: methyltransferase domain-containing protein [Pyrinomonadaceae bacterium]
MITPYRGSGIVLDIGTGDGRFVSTSAKAYPDKFFIGIDANAKPLEKLSTRITRKPAKGGLANAMFVLASVESLPEEFCDIADEIYISFPWGSLLGAVATGDPGVLASLSGVLNPKGKLQIIVGIEPNRDRTELERLGVPRLDLSYLKGKLAAAYRDNGLRMTGCRELEATEWSRIETSWARRLGGNNDRRVLQMTFVRVEAF